MNASVRRALAAATVSGAAAAALLVTGTNPSSADPPGPSEANLDAVRDATERFHDVDVAGAEGYIRVSGCEALSGVGAMGIHYLNPTLASDSRLVPTQPELLLYEPTDAGLALVGVEYFVTEAAAKGPHPAVMGRDLEGPMDGHSAQMPRHYDLHVWIWRDNPNGVTATWNPAVTCPSES